MAALTEEMLAEIIRSSGYSRRPLSDDHITEIAKQLGFEKVESIIDLHENYKRAATKQDQPMPMIFFESPS